MTLLVCSAPARAVAIACTCDLLLDGVEWKGGPQLLHFKSVGDGRIRTRPGLLQKICEFGSGRGQACLLACHCPYSYPAVLTHSLPLFGAIVGRRNRKHHWRKCHVVPCDSSGHVLTTPQQQYLGCETRYTKPVSGLLDNGMSWACD